MHGRKLSQLSHTAQSLLGFNGLRWEEEQHINILACLVSYLVSIPSLNLSHHLSPSFSALCLSSLWILDMSKRRSPEQCTCPQKWWSKMNVVYRLKNEPHHVSSFSSYLKSDSMTLSVQGACTAFHWLFFASQTEISKLPLIQVTFLSARDIR